MYTNLFKSYKLIILFYSRFRWYREKITSPKNSPSEKITSYEILQNYKKVGMRTMINI